MSTEQTNIFGRPTEVLEHGHLRVESNTSTPAELRAVLEVPKDADRPEGGDDAMPAPKEPEALRAKDAEPDAEPTDAEADQLGLRHRNTDGTFKRVGPKKRIEELLGKHRVAEQRAAAAEAEIARLRAESDAARRASLPAPVPATAQPGDVSRPKPTIHDFVNDSDPYAALAEGLTDWKLEQRDYQQRQQHEARQARIEAETRDRQTRDRLASFNARLEDARQKDAQFDDIINAATHAVPPSPQWQRDFNEAIAESPVGPAVLKALAQDPEEYQKLAGVQNKGELFRVLGRVEARVLQQESAARGSTTPVFSNARPPIRPPRSGPSKTEESVDEASLSVSEIARRDRERMAASFNARTGRG